MAQNIQEEDDPDESLLRPSYRTQPWRWYMLATVAFLGFSHGLNWLTFSSVFKSAAEYYQVTPTEINYMSIIFNVGALVGAPFGMFVLDSLSLREALWIGSFLTFAGSALRVVSAYLPRGVPYLGYSLATAAQFIIALAQPYSLFAPPKVASVWFADNERVFANSVASLMGVMGIGVSMVLGPAVVHSTGDLPTLLFLMLAFAFISILMTVCGVWMKKPKFPPSPSALKEIKTWSGIKDLVRKWKFWFLCTFFAVEAGSFNVALALMPQLLCPYGYDLLYSGVVGASMIFAGLLSATLCGYIVDKTKLFLEISKVSICLAIICSCIISVLFRIPNQQAALATVYILFGITSLIQLPVFVELTIEVTYPVPVSTLSGVINTFTQVFGGVLLFIAPYFGQDPDPSYRDISKCQPDDYNTTAGVTIRGVDYTNFYYLYLGLAVAFMAVYVLGFTTRYKRLEAEREIRRKEREVLGDQ